MRLKPGRFDAPAIVDIDCKSPYAYLPVAPTRELVREFGVQLDCRRVVSDIPGYLGTTSRHHQLEWL